MADLIAIGYEDETAAAQAAEEVDRLSHDLVIEPDAVAVIVCDKDGRYQVTTNHHPVAGGSAWGMFWDLLFGAVLFVPVLGMPVGAGLGALMGKLEKTVDTAFGEQVREMLKLGTSALFIVVENVAPEETVEALTQYGGTVHRSSLSKDAAAELQRELHGEPAPV